MSVPDEWVVGIDLGTTYFKVGLFDRSGRLGGLGRVAVDADTGPDGLRCELPAAQFTSRLRKAWGEACRAAGKGASGVPRICGVSYSSQANSFLLLDGDGQPLTPIILWPDKRAAVLDDAVAAYDRRPDRLAVTGIGLSVSDRFFVNKLSWIRARHPDIWGKVRRIMTISDYLVFLLSGRQAGDLGTAGLLSIVDPCAGDWWPAALAGLSLEKDMLTELAPPGTVAGTTQPSASCLDMPAGIPLALGGLDHHMAAAGAGVPVRAPVSVSLGTVLACLAVTDDFRPRPDCCCGRGFAGQGYTLLTFRANAGGNLEWFRRCHAPQMTLAELDAAADRIPLGCDGLEALPDAAAHSDYSGFRNAAASHTTGHYYRALLESTAHSLRELLQPLGKPSSLVLTGGGARSAVWRRIINRITGCAVLTDSCPEPACRGAAMAAAFAAGWFPCIADAGAAWTGAPD